MTTGVAGVASRQDPRQVVNTLKRTINWNDNASGINSPLANYLPKGAFISRVLVEVVTTFDGTTPSITVGSAGGGYTDVVAAGDVNEGVAGVYDVPRALGRSLAAAADILLYATYSNGGGGPTKGQAVVLIEYEGGWDT